MKKIVTLKRLVASLMLGGLLANVSSSRAITWTIDLHTDFGGAGQTGDTPWTSVPQGVSSVGGQYANFLAGTANDPSSYLTPTTVTFGNMVTGYNLFGTGAPAGADSFNVSADFNISLAPLGSVSPHVISVTGIITGSLNDNQSNAFWNLTGLDDTNSNVEILNTQTFLPLISTTPAWQLRTIVDGRSVVLWIPTRQRVASNGLSNAFLGYIADVSTVSGTISLQSTVNSVQLVTFTFHPAVGASFNRTVTLSANGSYSLSNIPADNYRVSIKGAKWLRKTITVNAITSNVTNANATLLAGDANNDNFADIGDLLLLIGAYNKIAPNAGYSEAADFNCDGADDIADLLLLIANYNTQGDA